MYSTGPISAGSAITTSISRCGIRKLSCRLPSQDLDADHRQRGENEDYKDLAEVVDRRKERQPEQEDEGQDRIDDHRPLTQVGRQEAPHRDLMPAGPCDQPPADEPQPDYEHEQRS